MKKRERSEDRTRVGGHCTNGWLIFLRTYTYRSQIISIISRMPDLLFTWNITKLFYKDDTFSRRVWSLDCSVRYCQKRKTFRKKYNGDVDNWKKYFWKYFLHMNNVNVIFSGLFLQRSYEVIFSNLQMATNSKYFFKNICNFSF